MEKTRNHRAWFLVLPVLVVVAFSAVIPLMTVVNYAFNDTFGNNEFFWAGLEWFDKGTVDGAAMGSATLATGLGAWLRKSQNGYVRSYGLIVGVGVIVLAGVVIIGQLG